MLIDHIYQFQTNELEGLGVSVYNQEEYEAGVEQQVDQAITLEEEMAAKQRGRERHECCPHWYQVG